MNESENALLQDARVHFRISFRIEIISNIEVFWMKAGCVSMCHAIR